MYFVNEEKLDFKTINEVDGILFRKNITAEEALTQITPRYESNNFLRKNM